MKNLLALFLSILLISFVAFAEEENHEKEFINGSGFELVKSNDVMVGTFNDIPIWADKKCGDHINGIYKKGEAQEEFNILIVDKQLKGTFAFGEITLQGFNKEKQEIYLKLADNSIATISYAYETFANAHFQNILFKFKNGDKEYNINVKGKACMGSMMFYAIFFYGVTAL